MPKYKNDLLAMGAQWLECTWPRPGGVTAGVVMGQPTNPSSPLVLFLHGAGNDCLFPNAELFRVLISVGYTVATADIDGHGKDCGSILDASHAYSMVEDFVQEIKRLRPGPLRIHLAGFSLGACLMLEYAARNQHVVKSLTMIGMPVFLSENLPFSREALTVTRRSFLNSRSVYGFWGMIPAFGVFRRGAFPVRLAKRNQSQWNYLHVARKIIDGVKTNELLPTLTIPAVCISGELDFIAPLADIKALELPSTHLKIYRVPGETHFTSMLATQTAKYMEVFLNDCDPRG